MRTAQYRKYDSILSYILDDGHHTVGLTERRRGFFCRASVLNDNDDFPIIVLHVYTILINGIYAAGCLWPMLAAVVRRIILS